MSSDDGERTRLIQRIHSHLERHGRPRLELFVLVGASGLVGLLVSVLLLGAGFRSMPLRYGVAGSTGYLAFLGLLALWIAYKRRGESVVDSSDALEAIDVDGLLQLGSSDVDGDGPAVFAGGRSGGGGASASWGSSRASSSDKSGWLDADVDLGWLLVLLAAALSALLAVGYVVWAAPALLAEVLVDAVIVSAVSGRVAATERRDWTATVIRRTWLPAIALILALVAAGWALQKLAPEAHSIGPALESILD